MEKYKNKYRIKSARLPCWDYGDNGIYFITICTKNKECLFGEISGVKMQLNESGKLAYNYWKEIPEHFPFIQLGEFVIMPNHIHGILIMDKSVETLQCNVSAPNQTLPNQTLHCNVSTSNQMPHDNKNQKMVKISPKPGSISTIIRSYKSAVSKNARKSHAGFGWQTRFFDHIIRNEKTFHSISEYIRNNLQKWEEDKFYTKSLSPQ